MASITELENLKTAGLCIMATSIKDQENVSETALNYPDKIIPCFGFHPWFVHAIYDDSQHQTVPDKAEHYRSVIRPEPDQAFIDGMPELQPLSQHVASLRKHLEQHKQAMVGEVGLDKAFRIPDPDKPRESSTRNVLSKHRTTTEHQTMVLIAQLKLAAEYNRACSIHGVQVSGYLHNAISQLWTGFEKPSKSELRRQAAADKHGKQGKLEFVQASRTDEKPFPPRICLHSYSGAQDMVNLWTKANTPADMFFSFSQVINGRYDRWEEVVKRVPDDRILIESDYHDARLIDSSLQEALDFVCKAKGWSDEEGREVLERNWFRFVGIDRT